MKKPKLFLSYAREDRRRVEDLYDSLRAEGFSPWIDTRDIQAGSKWSTVIGNAIRNADYVLAFISKNSVSKRGFVQRELQIALSILTEFPEDTIFLIPIRLDETPIPASLQDIHCVNFFEKDGWQRLLLALRRDAKRGEIQTSGVRKLKEDIQQKDQADKAETRAHVFVAMPFSVDMEDMFYYGIREPVEANGFRCIRVDKRAFTGDILEQVKINIQTAVAVVAELTTANPNVHLEVGYAWGKAVPTVLLLRHGEEPCFNVRGQRCLTYRTIRELQSNLTEELKRLKENGDLEA